MLSVRNRNYGLVKSRLSAACGLPVMASVLPVAFASFMLLSCENSKERKPAQKPGPTASPTPIESPDTTSPNGGTNTNGNVNTPGGNPTAAGDATYLTPRSRPTKVSNGGAGTRDVTANDVFVTPVYLDGSSWLKICASMKADGIATPFLVGCTHEATGLDGSTKSSAGLNPKFVLDSPLTVGLTAGGKRLNIEFQVYAQENNTGCGASGCPGPFTKKLPSKSTESAPASIKCIKSGNALVLFIDDKSDKDVADDAAYRSKLLPEGGSGSVPALPNLRNLHDPALLSAVYAESGGAAKVSERDVRRKFGVDFDDLILQVDLGTSGHKLAGYESCN